jgi:hypothetical protein
MGTNARNDNADVLFLFRLAKKQQKAFFDDQMSSEDQFEDGEEKTFYDVERDWSYPIGIAFS